MHISNLNVLFPKQFDKHCHMNRNTFCHFCRFYSPSIHKLVIHLRYCLSLKQQAYISLPSSAETIKHNDQEITVKVKIKLESFSQVYSGAVYSLYNLKQFKNTNRQILTKHIPSQMGYYISSTTESFNQTPKHYREYNADKMFVTSLSRKFRHKCRL